MRSKRKDDALSLFDTLVYTCQYRLVIDPAGNAMARAMEWRQQLRERIGKFNEAYQMPGITLFGSELPPEYEGPLADAVERGAEGFEPFTMNLIGLKHTEDRKSIYVELQEKGIVAALRQRVVDHVRSNRRIKKLGVEVVEHPTLFIASGLKLEQFNSAWAMLSAQRFSTQQRVSDVVLMKRELDHTSTDEHVRTFPLRSPQMLRSPFAR
ncbi:MAG: 2'-5' RNA ligase family protein [Flavobacteriales bacterium]|nr:MAG: 2'-5' RNA ligase family protein [Flavobacteriales bacterium]